MLPIEAEGRHQPGPEHEGDPWWAETFGFDIWTAGGATAAFTWLTLLPVQRRTWYWCALVRRGERLLHLGDLDLPLPSTGLRIRTAGLWADHQCEAPFEQWTVQNEGYGVALDDPADALDRAYGEATPLAFDIEWYAAGPPRGDEGAYVQSGEAHSVIELVGGPVDVVGQASRWHTWGPLVLPTVPIVDEGPSVYWRGPGSLVITRVLTDEGWWTSASGAPV
jgi:hypothetical protein